MAKKLSPGAQLRGRPRKFSYEKAAQLRKEGMTYVAIGRELKVSDSAVYFALNPEAAARNNQNPQRPCHDCGYPVWIQSGNVFCISCRERALDDLDALLDY